MEEMWVFFQIWLHFSWHICVHNMCDNIQLNFICVFFGQWQRHGHNMSILSKFHHVSMVSVLKSSILWGYSQHMNPTWQSPFCAKEHQDANCVSGYNPSTLLPYPCSSYIGCGGSVSVFQVMNFILKQHFFH